jgi:hypothetical protein
MAKHVIATVDALMGEVDAKLKELGFCLDDDKALLLAEWLDAKIIEHGAACFASGLREAPHVTAAGRKLLLEEEEDE